MKKSIEIAWAAGFFEGEGSIGARSVGATQKSLWPLQRLQNAFGGSIQSKARESDGCYMWWICGQAGREFVKILYPHLSPRRQSQIDAKFLTDAKIEANKRARRADPMHYWRRHAEKDTKGRFTGRVKSPIKV